MITTRPSALTNIFIKSSLLFEQDVIIISSRRFRVFIPDGYFYVSHPTPGIWTHSVLNYIGPSDGIRGYIDGEEKASGTHKTAFATSAGDGRIVVGRLFTDRDEQYTSVQVDELIFFNAPLTSDDVQLIYNSVE